MELLVPVELTAAGRPLLVNGEIELKIFTKTDVNVHNKNHQVECVIFKDIVIVITNCRIVFITSNSASQNNLSYAIEFQKISKIEDCSSMFSRSSRISIHTNTTTLGIKFLIDGKEDFLKLSNEALQRKSWIKIYESIENSRKIEPTFSSHNAGISGILKRQEKDIENIENLRNNALTDLNSLMKGAADVVDVVKKYSLLLEDRKKSQDFVDSESVSGDINEMEELLQNIGMVSPVTRISSGRIFFQQLARQIADTMLFKDRLNKIGGMITLPDLFCIINRSRGTELLSPEDLYRACENINDLNIGLRFKRFPSNVMVLQSNLFTDQQVISKICEIIRSNELYLHSGISSSSLAIELKLSLVIAKEILLEAEEKVFLCRDESNGGIHFFLNRFRNLN